MGEEGLRWRSLEGGREMGSSRGKGDGRRRRSRARENGIETELVRKQRVSAHVLRMHKLLLYGLDIGCR